ncbi:MAG: hypothetical protein RDV48_15815 [Candidatus Eremiobacteraeota bacterium]|nr:hypothetical protein [Candidatus Eremiobacteraeota bacterium]
MKWLKLSGAAYFKDLLAVLFFTGMSLLFTYPGIESFTTDFIGHGKDLTITIWGAWWFKYSLQALHQSPFFCDYVFYPLGQSLGLQGFSLVNVSFFYLLQDFFSLSVSWNILTIVDMTLPALSMYFLGVYLFNSRAAAMFSAIIFAYCPWMSLHATQHIFDVSSYFTLPLFILALIRHRREGGRRWIIWAGFVWSLSLYCCFTTPAFLGLIFMVYTLWSMAQQRGSARKIAGDALAVLLVFLVFSSPVLYKAFSQLAIEGGGNVHWIKADEFSFDPGALFFPGSNHFLAGAFVKNPFQSAENLVETTSFFGYSALFLLVLAFINRKKLGDFRFFFWSFLVFSLLSLGPSLHLFGWTGERLMGAFHLGGAKISIPLPYAAFYFIPLLSQLRWPVRLLIVMIFSAAVLAAWALNELLLKKASTPGKRLILSLLFCSLIAVEFLPIPFPTTSSHVPPELSMITRDREDCTVLFVPLQFMSGLYKVGFHTGEDMYYQIYHHKRLLSGYIPRVPLKKLTTFAKTRILETILLNQHLDQPQVPSNILDYREELKKLGELERTDHLYRNEIVSFFHLRYVVVMEPQYLRHTADYVERLFGEYKAVDKRHIRIYRIP